MSKKVGSVTASGPKRADEGKARPSNGSSKVGVKKGFLPMVPGGAQKYHEMGHEPDGKDGSGIKDSGKKNSHGHTYGKFREDTRTNGIGGPSK